MCSGCPPGFLPGLLLLLFLFLPFFGLEYIYPFPQGAERLTLAPTRLPRLCLLLFIGPLPFRSLSCPVRLDSNSLSRFFIPRI